MPQLYGRPQKLVRHVDEDDYTLEPERFVVHGLWKGNTGAAARSDGDDLLDTKTCPMGSKITKHKMSILVTPETIEPQQLYIGRIKLSFQDAFSPQICGIDWDSNGYQGAVTSSSNVSNAITPHLYPDNTQYSVKGEETANQEIGGSASGKTIKDWLLDDQIKHFINMKKVTVFDQRPLMGERWQRIPSKVKRINPYTFYGLIFYNDSARGATPADTQIKINIKSYWEEMAL